MSDKEKEFKYIITNILIILLLLTGGSIFFAGCVAWNVVLITLGAHIFACAWIPLIYQAVYLMEG